MSDFSQIVLGNGSSGLTYLYCALQTGDASARVTGRTLVVGDQDLWARNNPDHEMGQPQHILYPLNTPREAAVQTGPADKTDSNFLTAGQYTRQTDRLREDVKAIGRDRDSGIVFERGTATGVRREGAGYLVTVRDKWGKLTSHTAAKVVVACGTGPGATPSMAQHQVDIVNADELAADRRSYPEIVSGEEYYWNFTGIEGGAFRPKVCIYGASATSSWDLAQAVFVGAEEVMWVARKSFSEASPVGRNANVLLYSLEHEYLRLGTVRSITVDRSARGRPEVPRLRVAFGPPSADATDALPLDPSIEADGGEVRRLAAGQEFVCHQFVAALGADPKAAGAPGALLSDELRRELAPIYDVDKRAHARSDTAVVALANPDRSLLVVGATVFRGLGDRALSGPAASYKDLAAMFCQATRPPEGIFVLKEAIKVVTGYAESVKPGEFNWVTADRREWAAFLKDRYGDGLSGPQRDAVADAVMAAQSGKQFGFSKTEAAAAVRDAVRAEAGRDLGDTFQRKWAAVKAATLKK